MIRKFKRPLYWVGILVVAGLASAIGKEIGGFFGQSNASENLNAAMKQAVKQINDRGPLKVDEVTTLLRAEDGGAGNMVTYFELANYDAWGPKADLSAGRAAVIKALCAKPQTLKTMRMGATYGYVYLKEDGRQVYRFNVSKADCP